jgi:hypothetical protein
MKEIILPKGYKTIIDDEDFEKISNINWYVSTFGYVVGYGKMVNGKRKLYRMHRVIVDAPKDKVVDHVDGNKLNNQKSNLRICTPKDNNRNLKKRKNTKSKYKGVRKVKRAKGPDVYRATIQPEGKHIHLGYYKNEIDAAIAYNEAAIKYYKEFAKLNEIR